MDLTLISQAVALVLYHLVEGGQLMEVRERGKKNVRMGHWRAEEVEEAQ